MSFVGNVLKDFREVRLQQKYASAENQLTTLAPNESRGYRLPICYANDQFMLTDTAAWLGFSIPPKTWGFLDAKAVKSYWTSSNQIFTNIFPADRDNQGHILVTNRVHSADEWERNLIERHAKTATDTWRGFVKATRQAIDTREFFEREPYMFVRLGDRGRGGIRGKLREGMEFFLLGAGMEDTQPDDAEIEDWWDVADNVADTMITSWLNALPINRRRIEWLVRHLDSPSLPTPDTIETADREPWGIGQWRTVLSAYTRKVDLGRVAKSRYTAIEFDSPAGKGKSYAAYLPLAYIPGRTSHDINWIHHAAALSFPVDVSLRFEIIDPDRSARMVQRQINAAEAQAEEDAEAGIRPDDTTAIQQQSLRQVKTKVKMAREPIAYWQAVFCVYDTDPDELRSKITQLIKHYKDIHFDLVNPPLDQRELFYQSLPGSEIEVEDWIHRSDPGYLANSQPWLTSAVGDKDGGGLYQGFTLTRDANGYQKKGSPVFYDLLSVVDDENRAPTEVCAAESGSGKTVSRGLKCAYEDYHRGVTQFIYDPKGDFLALAEHAEWMGIDRDKLKLIDLHDPSTSVSLDPYGVAEVDLSNPTSPRDDRESAAMDVLTSMLADVIAADKLIADRLLRIAAKREIEKEKGLPASEVMRLREEASDRALENEPCLEGVMRTLEEWEQHPETIPLNDDQRQREGGFVAGTMAAKLRTTAGSTLGRLLFRRPSNSGALNVGQGDLVIFVAINMTTTEPGDKQTEKTLLPDIISGMMTDYIRSWLYRLPDHYIKCATFDEWHVIKRVGRADALVRWMRRMARSKRCMVRQMSQSALDFYNPADVSSSRTSIATAWCGKVDSEDEAAASCALLGIEPSEMNMGTLLNLNKGQFLFRDAFGRVQLIQVDIFDKDLLDKFDTSAKAKEQVLERLHAESAAKQQGDDTEATASQ